jgi:hypothetical protein
MKNEIETLSDDELLARFRDASIRHRQSLWDPRTANRINDEELVPSYDALVSRGQASALKILQLAHDDNPDVRLSAAILGYDLDPLLCRSVLIEFFRTPGFSAMTALINLVHKDPEVGVEFSRLAALGATDAFGPLLQRFSQPRSAR